MLEEIKITLILTRRCNQKNKSEINKMRFIRKVKHITMRNGQPTLESVKAEQQEEQKEFWGTK